MSWYSWWIYICSGPFMHKENNHAYAWEHKRTQERVSSIEGHT